jgi:hypothetical protein
MKNEEAILARLDALEAEVASLKVNAGLVVKPAARGEPAKYVEPKVSITHPIEHSPIALPTEAELWRIHRVVLSAYPELRPNSTPRYEKEDSAGVFREFCAAFAGISHLRRTEEIDHKHSVSWWAKEATGRLGRPVQDISNTAFLAAVIGSGDIKFTLTDHYGNVAAVGLARSGGLATEAGWRRALNGQLLLPVAGRFRAPPGGSQPSGRLAAELAAEQSS